MRQADATATRSGPLSAADGEHTPPATVILLVRHGTTETTGKLLPGRAPGLHLSDAGTRQAQELADHIARITAADPATDGDEAAESPVGARRPALPRRRVAAVYASPLERTCETAEPIARAVGRPVEIDEGLIELDIGDWTGMELKEASQRREWATIQRFPSGFRFPGGESFLDMQLRMVTALARFRSRHPGETVVAVSHADPIRSVVAHALGTHLDLFQRLVVSPCSLTAMALGDVGPIVLTVNAVPGVDGRG